ncbi:MAG TPA: hypothetical protein VFA26_11400, partial [Gemmataceae bacterium]|nr:hypothetical protein [Gemmataceae bacterium]
KGTATVGEGDTLSGSATAISATEGTALTAVQVATFSTTYTANTADDFTATIDWGDGSTSAATITGSGGSFTVKSVGSHTYADEGSYTVTVTIKDDAPGTASLVLKGTATVAEADVLKAVGVGGTTTEGVLYTGTVATFTTTYLANTADDFAATIDWGDGSATVAAVIGASGTFVVATGAAGHVYADEGTYTATVTVWDVAPGTAFTTATLAITVGETDTLTGSTTGINTTEGTGLSGVQVASFSTTYAANPAADFTATIDWGDGSTSAGVITGSNGNFTVTPADNHAYADEGSYTFTVTIKDDAPGTATLVLKGTATVAEADVLSGSGDTVSATAGTALDGVRVATFASTYTGSSAGDFTATIDWGDGSTVAGTVSGANGSFTVAGGHTYASAGTYDITVTVTDDAPGTAAVEITGTAEVAAPPPTPNPTGDSAANPADTSTTIRLQANSSGGTVTPFATASTNAALPANTSSPASASAANGLPPNSTGNLPVITFPVGGAAAGTAAGPLTLAVPAMPQAGAVGLLSAGQGYTYQLTAGPGGQDNALFTIQGNELRATVPLTQVGATYSLRVRVTDGSGRSFEQIIRVTVTPGSAAPGGTEESSDSLFLTLDDWLILGWADDSSVAARGSAGEAPDGNAGSAEGEAAADEVWSAEPADEG